MLPLPPFTLLKPQSLEELQQCLQLSDQNTKIIAGGTDLLPNLKHGIYDINRLLSLRHVPELRGTALGPASVRLGSLVSMRDVATNHYLHEHLPILTEAAAAIASPQIRAMGTVGGNICLDTRCLYINQSDFWRKSLGFCLKKDGNCCHVVKTGKRCVAAASNDLAHALLALNARITILSSHHERDVLLSDFYVNDGQKNNILNSDEVVANVTIIFDRQTRSGFYKLRFRHSIDFSLISASVAFRADGDRMLDGTLVVGGLVAKPKILPLTSFAPQTLTPTLIDEIAQWAQARCHPQTNICGEPDYRKEMIAVAVTRAFTQALNQQG